MRMTVSAPNILIERGIGRRSRCSHARQQCAYARLETVDLDGLAIETQALLLISQEILHIFALVSLELNHLAHLGIGDDGAIAGKLLLDDLEDLLLVEFLRQALDRGQGFTTIALLGSSQPCSR